MVKPDEYKVEGYGERHPEYDQPYLAGAGFDPGVAFAKAGDPKAQAKHQNVITDELPGDETFAVVPSHTPVNPTHPKTLKAPEFGRDLQLNGEPLHPGPEDLNPDGKDKTQLELEDENDDNKKQSLTAGGPTANGPANVTGPADK